MKRQMTCHVDLRDRATGSVFFGTFRIFKPTKAGRKIELNPTPGIAICEGPDDGCQAALERLQERLLRLARLVSARTWR